MVRQNKVLPYLIQKWYGSCRAVRTDGVAHDGDMLDDLEWLHSDALRGAGDS